MGIHIKSGYLPLLEMGVAPIWNFFSTMDKNECLILGPEGTGKTLLLKKLSNLPLSNKKNPTPNLEISENTSLDTDLTAGIVHTVPTAGTNIERVKLSNSVWCTLRECGQSIAPLWSSYYTDCNMVLYVVDITNLTQISAATMLLLDILTAKELRCKPMLIFFNKCDCELRTSLTELKSIMRLDELIENTTQSVRLLEGSCVTKEGLKTIIEWIIENANL